VRLHGAIGKNPARRLEPVQPSERWEEKALPLHQNPCRTGESPAATARGL